MVSRTYKMSMALQGHLDDPRLSRDEQVEALTVGLQVINEFWDPAVDRAAGAESAYFSDTNFSAESQIFPFVEFGGVALRGSVPRIDAIINEEDRLVVALPFFRAVVFESLAVNDRVSASDDVLPEDLHLRIGQTLDRPLMLPVEDLRFVILAAR
ncbi:MAG: hypothetical protein R3313_00335 [Candidatus Saccharimonadales bacterium]|nr:hypothetical protein [Candidatus Saccharimonadales bacterium]